MNAELKFYIAKFLEGLVAWLTIPGVAAFFLWCIYSSYRKRHPRRETAEATVVGKRTDVRTSEGGMTTAYFATFQTAEGQRVELAMDGKTYGMLVELDQGVVTYQSGQCLTFQRNNLQ